MALPSANLTLHVDASDADRLFKFENQGTGVPTGTPSDGELIQVWDDESDSTATDVLMGVSVNPTTDRPTWRASAPLMARPCLDFIPSPNANRLTLNNQIRTAERPISVLVTASAFTIAVAFRPDSGAITSTATNYWERHTVLADSGAFIGLLLYVNAGVKTLYAINWDGTADALQVPINEAETSIAIFRHGGGFINLTHIAQDRTETTPSAVASGNTTDLTHPLQFAFNFAGIFGTPLYDGRIGEVAIYNAELTGTDYTDLKSYFVDKWLTFPTPFPTSMVVTRMGGRR